MNTTCNHSLSLAGQTAGDLMTPNPVSIGRKASAKEAIKKLAQGFSALPVIDDHGRPLGFLTRGDILTALQEGFETVALTSHLKMSELFENLKVEKIIQFKAIQVHAQTPVLTVINKMLLYRVHRLFVVDAQGKMIGIITSIDILLNLRVTRESHMPEG